MIKDSDASADRDVAFDMTECFLAALHGNPTEDPDVFDGFAPPMRALATELARRRLKAQKELAAARSDTKTTR
ncbi:hypothetical protein GXW82_43940 [Streptacidiphilus sp. 4-A2]|nr:hypothetical protein [Streptacidiphilus sp. 4-A2]